MQWEIWALFAIVSMGIADFFKKFGASIPSPAFATFIFQLGGLFITTILLLFDRRFVGKPLDMGFSFLAGVGIALFTYLGYRALAFGQNPSIVMPLMRGGGVLFTALLAIFVLKEQLTAYTGFGILFCVIGIFLLFYAK